MVAIRYVRNADVALALIDAAKEVDRVKFDKILTLMTETYQDLLDVTWHLAEFATCHRAE